MTISAHLLLAVALLIPAILVVICEPTLRRRIRNYRVLQLFAIGSALVLVPLNAIATATHITTTHSATVDTLILVASLAALAVQAINTMIGWLPAPKPMNGRRVLAIGAHPDDLELACGGTISKLADAGHEVHTLTMSAGQVGGDASVRPDEASKGARLMGVAKHEVLDFPDTKLGTRDADLVAEIEARIKAFNPDIILTHSSHDQHQDHYAVHLATLRAARRHPAILCYESPSATPDFAPQVFVDIEDYLDAKHAAIAQHRNQLGKPYMGDETVAAMASFRGAQARQDAAEAFEAVRVPGFAGVL